MARSNAQLAAEVQRRAGQLREKRTRRWKQALSSAAGICFAAVCLFAVRTGPGVEVDSAMPAGAGATELMGSAAAGGYVLVGVLCFALGIGFVLICTRARAKNNSGADDASAQRKGQDVRKDQKEIGD